MFFTLEPVMAVVVLDLVDYSLLKVKQYQNLCLISSGGLFLFVFLFSGFSGELITDISTWFLVGAIATLLLMLLLYIPFIFNRSVGTAIIANSQIKVSSTTLELIANLNDVCFKLAVSKEQLPTDGILSEDLLKKLPKWGSYIQIKNGACVAFLPNAQMADIRIRLNLIGYDKPPYLLMSTKELAKQIADMLSTP